MFCEEVQAFSGFSLKSCVPLTCKNVLQASLIFLRKPQTIYGVNEHEGSAFLFDNAFI